MKERHLMRKGTTCAVLLGVAVMLGISVDAWAESDSGGIPVVVDRETCLRLLETAPASGTADAEYQPGVDAYGRPVVPADGPGGPAHDWLPEVVEIRLSVPLAAKLGIGDGATNYEADAQLGTLTLRHGRVFLNGREVSSSDLPEVREACRRLDVIRDAAGERKPDR